MLVLNGSGRPGAATAQSNALKAKGYQTLDPGRRAGPHGQHRVLQGRASTASAPRSSTSVDGAPKVGGDADPAADRQRDRELRRHPRRLAHTPVRARRARPAGRARPTRRGARRLRRLARRRSSTTPTRAIPLPAARDALAALVGRVGLVAVVSGRPVAFLRDALGIDGVTYVGQYGLAALGRRAGRHRPAGRALSRGRSRRSRWPRPRSCRGCWSSARTGSPWCCTGASGPSSERAAEAWAARAGRRGRARAAPGARWPPSCARRSRWTRATVVEELCAGLAAAAFAGDDAGDLAAFDALDRLQASRSARRTRCAIGVQLGRRPARAGGASRRAWSTVRPGSPRSWPTSATRSGVRLPELGLEPRRGRVRPGVGAQLGRAASRARPDPSRAPRAASPRSAPGRTAAR